MQTSIIFSVAFFAVAFLVIVFVMSYIKAAPDEAIIVSGLRKLPKVIIGRAGALESLSLNVQTTFLCNLSRLTSRRVAPFPQRTTSTFLSMPS